MSEEEKKKEGENTGEKEDPFFLKEIKNFINLKFLEFSEFKDRFNEFKDQFNYRIDQLEQRICRLQQFSKLYSPPSEDIFEWIRENQIVTKSQLMHQFGLSKRKHWEVVKYLPPDIRYVYINGSRVEPKFVYVSCKEAEEAMDAFFNTKWGQPIVVNSTEVNFWLKTIFDEFLTPPDSRDKYFLKGGMIGLTKRGRKIVKKSRV